MKKIKIILGFVMMFTLLSSFAFAYTNVTFVTGSANGDWNSNTNGLQAQTFSATENFTLTNLGLLIARKSGVASQNLEVYLYDVDGSGVPNNRLSVLKVFDILELNESGNCNTPSSLPYENGSCMFEIEVDTPYELTETTSADERYAIVLNWTTTSQIGLWWWNGDGTNRYTDGLAYRGTWTSQGNSDYYFKVYEVPITDTSDPHNLEHIHGDIIGQTPTIISTTDYVLVGNYSFNLTTSEELYIKGAGYVSSTANAQANLFLKIENNETIFNSSVVSVNQNNDYRQFSLPITKYEAVAGVNSIGIYAKKSGTGNVELYNLDLHIDSNRTSGGDFIETFQYDNVGNVSSTSLSLVYNYTVTRTSATSNYLADSNIKLTSYATNPITVECVYKDVLGNNISEPMRRTLNYNGDIGSTGQTGYVNGSLIPTQSITAYLYCKGSTAETFQVNGYDTVQIMETTNGNYINGQTYNNSEISLSSGISEVLNFNYTVVNASSVGIPFTVSLQSTSGVQDGTKTPIISANGQSCTEYYLRSLTDNDDIGTIKGYLDCDSLTSGNTYNFTLTVEVAVGESLTVRTASATVYETSALDVTSLPVPLTADILNPVDDSVLSNVVNILYNVIDIRELGFTSELILYYDNGSVAVVLLNESTKENTTTSFFNSLNFDNGDYYLSLRTNDGLTNSSDTVDITLYNAEKVIYSDGSYGTLVCPDNVESILNFWFGVALCIAIIWLGNNYQAKVIGFIGVIGIFYLSTVYYGCNNVIGSVGIALSIFMLMAVAYSD